MDKAQLIDAVIEEVRRPDKWELVERSLQWAEHHLIADCAQRGYNFDELLRIVEVDTPPKDDEFTIKDNVQTVHSVYWKCKGDEEYRKLERRTVRRFDEESRKTTGIPLIYTLLPTNKVKWSPKSSVEGKLRVLFYVWPKWEDFPTLKNCDECLVALGIAKTFWGLGMLEDATMAYRRYNICFESLVEALRQKEDLILTMRGFQARGVKHPRIDVPFSLT